jgi:hypothetical protein
MTTKDDNTQIRYEGNALMWQGANRIQADRIDIDKTEWRPPGARQRHDSTPGQGRDAKTKEGFCVYDREIAGHGISR